MASSDQIVRALLQAIESRDLRAISERLHPEASWQNVPHPASEGREAVLSLLAGILCWSDAVRWDITSCTSSGDTAWFERVDRFWIDGEEYAVPCNGVFSVDLDAGTVVSVRDYVDLGEWRQRIEPIYLRLAARTASEVVARHLIAVEGRDPVAMAADYALDATLERKDRQYRGWFAIADYFDTVPGRLSGRPLTFSPIEAINECEASVDWRIGSESEAVATGTDRYEVRDGRIVYQHTQIYGADF